MTPEGGHEVAGTDLIWYTEVGKMRGYSMPHEYLPGTVGYRIQNLINEKKITQAILAEKTGISKATLSRYISAEDAKIPHDSLLKIARYFGVSTDFLLGATDIPYRTNFDIEELGLTANAAKKLYTGEVNPHIISQMIENPAFAKVVFEVGHFVDGTTSAAMASYNKVLSITEKLLQKQGKTNPRDKSIAVQALKDVREQRAPVTLPETVMIRAAFDEFLANLNKQAKEHITESDKLTGDIMTNIIEHLEKRQTTFDLKQVTASDLSDAITEAVGESGYPVEKQEELRKNLLTMFENFGKPRRRHK